jgi:hypothetical protein
MPAALELIVHQCGCPTCRQERDPVMVRHHDQINLLLSRLTEPQRRWYVATLSQAPDSPSIRDLVLITGLSSSTIMQGRREIAAGLVDVPRARQRRPGGGRPATEKKIRTSKP